jgi:hypothetical protein
VRHYSIECKTPGERDADVKLPYSADFLSAPDERKKKMHSTNLSSESVSAGQNQTSSQNNQERFGQQTSKGDAAHHQPRQDEPGEISSPVKKKQQKPRANNARASKGQGKEKNVVSPDLGALTGQKRKSRQVYRVKAQGGGEAELHNPLEMVVHQSVAAREDVTDNAEDGLSLDSNKKSRKTGDRSADQAGAVEQPRQMQ